MCLFCCESYASYNVDFFIAFILIFDYFYNCNILVSQVNFTQQNTRSLKQKKTKKIKIYIYIYKVVQMLFIYLFLSKQKCTMFVHVQM